MPTLPGTWLEGSLACLPDPLPAISLVLVIQDGLPVTLLRTFAEVPRSDLIWASAAGSATTDDPRFDVLARAEGYPAGWGADVRSADVTVVIPTVGDPQRLDVAIRSLLPFLPTLREVLIVVNGYPSEPVRYRVGMLTDDSRIRVLTSDPGLSTARNVGLDAARSQYVAFLDDDVQVGAHWRTAIDRVVAMYPGSDLITGCVLSTPPASAAQFWFEAVGGFHKGFDELIVDGGSLTPGQALMRASKVGTGAVMVLRRGVDPALHFSETLGAGTLAKGGEDLDLVVRALRQGSVVVYAPDVIVRHPGPANWDLLRRQVFAYGRGLSAMVTHGLVTGMIPPVQIVGLLPGSVKTVVNRTGYAQSQRERFPVSLRLREAAGLMLGPFDYLRSRRQQRD